MTTINICLARRRMTVVEELELRRVENTDGKQAYCLSRVVRDGKLVDCGWVGPVRTGRERFDLAARDAKEHRKQTMTVSKNSASLHTCGSRKIPAS